MKCFSRLGCCIDREEFAMLRRVVSIVFVTGALVALMNAAPIQSVALLASPSAGTPGPGSPPTQELCHATDVIHTNTQIVAEPPGLIEVGEAGVVEPADARGRLLWVAEITIPPQTCRNFHSWDGAIALFVQSGSIEYRVSSTPSATVMMGHQDDATTFNAVPVDTLVPLHSGDWVTQDSAAEFAYRNPGRDSAVVLMAGYVVPPGEGEGSGGKG
jgi:hypothetical protein